MKWWQWFIVTLCASCGSLRPINRNHQEHLMHIAGKLGVEPGTLNWPSLEEEKVCNSLDAKTTGWTATAVVAGVLGGGAGITTTVLDDKTPRWAVGSVTVTLSAVSALSIFLSTHFGQRYAQKCSINLGGK